MKHFYKKLINLSFFVITIICISHNTTKASLSNLLGGVTTIVNQTNNNPTQGIVGGISIIDNSSSANNASTLPASPSVPTESINPVLNLWENVTTAIERITSNVTSFVEGGAPNIGITTLIPLIGNALPDIIENITNQTAEVDGLLKAITNNIGPINITLPAINQNITKITYGALDSTQKITGILGGTYTLDAAIILFIYRSIILSGCCIAYCWICCIKKHPSRQDYRPETENADTYV